MKTLPFYVTGQSITKKENKPFYGLVAGKEELQCKFIFGSDWNGYDKVVEFSSSNGPDFEFLKGDSITVPDKAAFSKKIRIKVYAARNKKVAFSTNYLTIDQR